jgi:hypothetical protein
MWPVFVVMTAVDPEHMLEVAAAEDEDPVEAVSADGADPSLSVGVRVRCLHWSPDHLQALGAEHLVEGVAELRVAIVDQEPEGCSSPSCMARLRACCAVQAPSGLDVQATYSIRRLASAMKNRHVDPLQKRRLDGAEVASEDGAGLRSQERPPRGRAHPRSACIPNADSRERAAKSSSPERIRVAACPASCADTSTGEQPAGGASEAACPP